MQLQVPLRQKNVERLSVGTELKESCRVRRSCSPVAASWRDFKTSENPKTCEIYGKFL